MLAVQVVCDVLDWDIQTVHTIHGSGEAIVAHLKKHHVICRSPHNGGKKSVSCSSQGQVGPCLTSVPCDSIITTQQSYWEWSFLDKADSSCLICWNIGQDVSSDCKHKGLKKKKKQQ